MADPALGTQLMVGDIARNRQAEAEARAFERERQARKEDMAQQQKFQMGLAGVQSQREMAKEDRKERRETQKQDRKILADAGQDIDAAQAVVQDLNRFEQLLETQDTGGMLRLPGAVSVAGAFDDEIQEMKAISDRLTPLMRQGMPGAASDRDVAMFRGATVGPEKNPEVNRNIITGMRASRQNMIDRHAFRQAVIKEGGDLIQADELWRKYLKDNPIFDHSKGANRYQLNPARMPWQEYFGFSGQGPIEGETVNVREIPDPLGIR